MSGHVTASSFQPWQNVKNVKDNLAKLSPQGVHTTTSTKNPPKYGENPEHLKWSKWQFGKMNYRITEIYVLSRIFSKHFVKVGESNVSQ